MGFINNIKIKCKKRIRDYTLRYVGKRGYNYECIIHFEDNTDMTIMIIIENKCRVCYLKTYNDKDTELYEVYKEEVNNFIESSLGMEVQNLRY